jgi:hypothetical protein
MRKVVWSKLAGGPHLGRTLPEVMLGDPDYVLDGLGAGTFTGAMLDEATEVVRRATRIRVPGRENVTVFYSLLPDDTLGSLVVISKSDPKLMEFARHSVAQSDWFDLTLPRGFAPKDPAATKTLLEHVLWQYTGDSQTRLTAEECAAFFDDPKVIAPDAVRATAREHST